MAPETHYAKSGDVNIAGRAEANEVLVSTTVKDLVAGSGLGFVDRGAHALKGIPGEWRLFAASEGAVE